MRGRRVVTLLAALTFQAGCVAIFGVDDSELVGAVDDMCRCDELRPLSSCVNTLTERLDGASADTQRAWLDRYVRECVDCKNTLLCLSENPTCTLGACALDEECCQVNAVQGKCVGGFCAVK